jgi:hypothetical protein
MTADTPPPNPSCSKPPICSPLLPLQALGREVRPDEEGSLLRIFYSALTERAHRRIGGDSVTLLLLQPSPSLRSAARGGAFKLSEFEEAGFSQRALGRLRALEGKGVQLTEAVLEKLGIPAPGSGHPSADGGRRAGQVRCATISRVAAYPPPDPKTHSPPSSYSLSCANP